MSVIEGYAIRAFGHAVGKDGMVFQNSLGFYEVTNPDVVNVIQHMAGRSYILKKEIETFIRGNTDESVDDILEYLSMEVSLLEYSEKKNINSIFASDSSRLRNVAEYLMGESVHVSTIDEALKNLNGDVAIMVGFEGSPCIKTIELFCENLNSRSYFSAWFQIGETIVITPNWLKSSFIPCPLCVYDFASNRVLFNPNDSMLSLSDVIDILDQYGIKEIPDIPISKDELVFAISMALRNFEIAEGRHVIRGHRIDPYDTTVIDLDTKRWSGTRVPFSPMCSCLRQFHSTTAAKVIQNA